MTFDEILSSLQTLLDYEFNASDLLLRSIITRSFLTDHVKLQSTGFHQDNFESLGDAVLNVLVIERAIHNSIRLSSKIDSIRQSSVPNWKLTEISKKLNLQDYIL